MEKLGDIIAKVLKRYGKRLAEERVKVEWVKIVGEDVAIRTVPLSLSDGVLEVAVPDGAWAKEYQFREEIFLEKLKDYDVRKIKFVPLPRLFLRGKR